MNPDPIPDPPRLREVFLRALDVPGVEARAAFIASACVGDDALRRRVEALLARHVQETFLATPAIEPGPAAAHLDGSDAEKQGTRIGDRYELLERLGEGGFGSVWMAQQHHPVRRRVALKILKLGMDTCEVVSRFEAERQALALMDHPGIARVFDAGATERGRPFFVMELVRGTAITTYCEHRKMSIPDRIRLFIQVCEAVQHAHQKGVIHRDLKPSNILVAEIDGRAQPKVIDFGVAKATATGLSPNTVFTRFRQILGTPAYMSPEQAGGAPDDIDTRADIYSLGVLLYELLTGRTPFDTRALLASGLDAILRVIRDQDPPLPSTRLGTLSREELAEVANHRDAPPQRLGRLVKGELDWITMRALEKERALRYATAQGFAEDLGRFLRQEPVVAALPSLAYRAAKFIRRNRTTVGTMAAIGVVLVAATVVSLRLAVIARQARDQAAAERDRVVLAEMEARRQRAAAEASATESLEHLVRLKLGNGQLLDERGDASGAALWFADALRQSTHSTLGDVEPRSRLASVLARSPALASLVFHEGPVRSVQFSSSADRIVSASEDGTARVWSPATGQLLCPPLSHAAPVLYAEFNSTSERVLTQCDDGTARVWDAGTGHPLGPPLVHRLPLKRARFVENGAIVITASGRAFGAAPRQTTPPGAAATHPDPSEHLPHRAESEIRAWDAASGREIRPSLWRPADLVDLVLDAPNRRFAACFSDGAISVWDFKDWMEWPLRKADEPKPSPAGVPTNLPGMATDSPLSQPSHYHTLAFASSGNRLLAAADAGTVIFWMRPGRDRGAAEPSLRVPLGPLVPPSTSTQGIVADPHGHRAASLDTEGVGRVWSLASGEPTARFAPPLSAPAGLAFDSAGMLVVLFGGPPGEAGTARVWNASTGQPVTPTLHHGAAVTAAALDATQVVTAGADGAVRVWSLASLLPTSRPGIDAASTQPEVLQAQAELLAARTLGPDGTPHPLDAEGQERRREFLQACGYSLQGATSDQVLAWHDRQAIDAEAHAQWHAAALHLERLAASGPATEALHARLSRARARAALALLGDKP